MRPRRTSRLLPPPLLLLLAAVTVVGFAWALLVPPWQSPDENAHFGYTQTLAENLKLPGGQPGNVLSTEQQRAARAVNADQVAANALAKPVWSERLYDSWRSSPSGARGNGGGAQGGQSNTARANPPAYYAWEAAPYLAASGGDVFDRLYLMRIWSVLLLLVAVAATWLLIGELAGPRPLLQLTGAAVVGLQPMATFLSASVSPDSLLVASSATVLWVGVAVLRRGLTLARGTALCGALAAAILSKAAGYAFVPAVLVALGVGVARLPTARQRILAVAPALAVGVPVGLWLLFTRLAGRPAVNQLAGGSAHLDVPGPLAYLWQYYLPQLPSQKPLTSSFPRLPAFSTFLEGVWAKFGWLEVGFPEAVYLVLAAVTALILVAGGVALWRHGLRGHWAVAAFLGIAVVGLLGGLHLAEYRYFQTYGVALLQGRYLLPLLPLFGVCAAAGLTLLRPARQAAAAGVLTAALFALQLGSLGLVAARFYA